MYVNQEVKVIGLQIIKEGIRFRLSEIKYCKPACIELLKKITADSKVFYCDKFFSAESEFAVFIFHPLFKALFSVIKHVTQSV